ncbi:flagellar biosynthetic protein FliO [Ferrimonas marina]|uniref:Flagellar protein n=1 Tax=Ferrimonas marina TaxID=299255 RepID=A0A1M5YEF1_9GAMM|nr:flagellar biosynthetic protein FliO [Ferrimonas marina]SHI10440.1 flagellar protein FliO/FliZ [Ferrimonas marina]
MRILTVLLAALALPVWAAEPVAGGNDQLVTVVASLFGVLALIIVLGVLGRRLNLPSQISGGQIKSVAMMPVGSKERVAVIQVGEQQYLVGITATQITMLDKLEQPLEAEGGAQFGHLLAKFNKRAN